MGFRADTVAGFPSVTPAAGPALNSTTLVFRADTAAGIVYVTGTFVTGATGTAFAAPLPAAFRPLATAALPALGGAYTGATFNVNPDGTASYTAAGGTYTVRAFYFLTVTPA